MDNLDFVKSDVRVAVTGLGLITPLGLTVEGNWEALIQGRSGIGKVSRFCPDRLTSRIAGEVKGFEPENYLPRKELKKMDTFIQYVIAATQMAFDDAGLSAPDVDEAPRYGAIIGVGLGGLPAIEENMKLLLDRGPNRISPFFIPMLVGNMAAGQVSMRWGLRGPNICTTTACASGSHAIGDAMKCIQRGLVDVMVAGGSEACITELGMAGFCAMRALSTRNDDPEGASRPFDADRDGFVMAEGAGVLVLERYERAVARGAEIYAELSGYGLTSDAHHITSPDPGGEGAARCMSMALDDAELEPEDVDYINAHGTSTGAGDKLETTAIKKTFGEHAYKLGVSSTKSMTGHLLGAAGGVETVYTILALKDQRIPPTVNLDTPDPECDLDYVPNTAREADIGCAITNSFGFGGTNASLLFKRAESNAA